MDCNFLSSLFLDFYCIFDFMITFNSIFLLILLITFAFLNIFFLFYQNQEAKLFFPVPELLNQQSWLSHEKIEIRRLKIEVCLAQ